MPLRLLGKGLRKIGRGFQRLGDAVNPPVPPAPPTPQRVAHEARLAKWYAIDGDQTLRLATLTLDENSVVFDLGGYDASFTVEVFARYACTVYLFEPCRTFFDPIQKRLGRNPRLRLFPFGLGATTRTEQIALHGAGTSVFRQSDATEPIELVRAADFFEQNPVPEIHLLKVNIEGGEYELLDHLLDTGLIRLVRDVQVQFHEDVLPDADERMRSIQSRLAETHTLTWQHEWIWENWQRKSG